MTERDAVIGLVVFGLALVVTSFRAVRRRRGRPRSFIASLASLPLLAVIIAFCANQAFATESSTTIQVLDKHTDHNDEGEDSYYVTTPTGDEQVMRSAIFDGMVAGHRYRCSVSRPWFFAPHIQNCVV